MFEKKSRLQHKEKPAAQDADPYDQSLWSGEKRERVAKARAQWEALMRTQEEKADPLEKFGSGSVSGILSVGRKGSPLYDGDKFTSLAIRKRKFDDKKVVWLSFPGLNSADSGNWNFFLEGSASVPGGMDAIPREGTAFVFHGPTSLAGYTPEQHIEAMENILASARLIKEKHPGYEIRVHGFSAGTAPAVFVANQLALEQNRPIDKLLLIAPGDTIAYGIFSTYGCKELADDLLRRGITPEEYHKAIERYTQMHNMKALPGGRNLIVHAATNDRLIEMGMPHGTDEFVQRLERAGKDPAYLIHEGRNHASIILSLLAMQRVGLDPYGLNAPLSIWENKSSFENPDLLQKMDGILSHYLDEDLHDVGDFLRSRAGDGARQNNIALLFSPPERAVIATLMRRKILSFEREGPGTAARLVLTERSENPQGYLARIKNRFKAVDNLSKIVAAIRTFDTETSASERDAMSRSIDVVAEIKKLGLQQDSYAVVIDGAFVVQAEEHLGIIVTPELYGTLLANGWKESSSGAVPPRNVEQHYRAHVIFNGEDLSSIKKDVGMIDGIPVVNRLSHIENIREAESIAA
ncbi:MAG: hypothetical protein HY460_01670 [Parcubacteria group bacterium]|nr:hypothetical protein [Parcubacteria group bacterium]